MLLAISPDGVEQYILYEGGLTSEVFNYFLINLIKRLRNYNMLNNAVLLMGVFYSNADIRADLSRNRLQDRDQAAVKTRGESGNGRGNDIRCSDRTAGLYAGFHIQRCFK